MKNIETNPFHELFVTDSAPAEEFVRYFSPFLVPHMDQLFRDGNVVLKGTQGCGKSMLLKLLQPEIRVAYFNRQRECAAQGGIVAEFPVPEPLRNFIGAGVNLSKSGLLDIAQMLSSNAKLEEFQNLTALFADLLNYWLLRDLLNSIDYVSKHAEVFGKLVNRENMPAFVELVRIQDCWFGYLAECPDFETLQKKVNERVVKYRSWLARNDEQLNASIVRSKTAIGEPLSRTVECLKQTGVVGRDIPVFLRIDQMEELWHREDNQAVLSLHFRRVINRVIGNRDLRVSFRIGTRRYAWEGELGMPGGRKIEEARDYVTIDLDQRLRRREDRKGWLFEGFASDVFRHRLISRSEPPVSRKKSTTKEIQSFFGASPTPHELVEKLIVNPPDDPQRLLKLDDGWSEDWRRFILEIYNKQRVSAKVDHKSNYAKDPLNALLAEAWGLQTGGVSGGPQRRTKSVPAKFPPWTVWWKKERMMLGVMQLVVRHQQTIFWWGTKRALALSASNITLFLSICREVWDQQQRRTKRDRDQRLQPSDQPDDDTIGWKVQAVAIDNVSKSWHRNFARQPGRPGGDVRMRFVDEIGNWLRRRMLADSAMSYPGGNGFSLRQSDLNKYPQLARLLEEAVGWGDLYEVEHTTKTSSEKHRDPRKKFYLNPILSPHFQLPDAHTKEPLYEPVETILDLAQRAGALLDDGVQLTFDAMPRD